MSFQEEKARLLKRYDNWWKRKGCVVEIHLQSDDQSFDYERFHTDPDYAVEVNLNMARNKTIISDNLPMSMVDYGTVSLASYVGAGQVFHNNTIWYEPMISDMLHREKLVFDGNSQWWQIQKQIIQKLRQYQDQIIIGCPGFSPGLDALASLRGTEELMMDLLDCPQAVKECLEELDQAYYCICDQIFPMLEDELGATGFGYFSLWGSGKTTQVQCDCSAMLSPGMFDEFVIPTIQKASEYFDNTMYHVDGTQCLCHVDSLLSVPNLTAIEWTPQAGIEDGGNPKWYPLYRKILDSGKALQVINLKENEILPLIDAIGYKGVYFNFYPHLSRESADRIINDLSKISGIFD